MGQHMEVIQLRGSALHGRPHTFAEYLAVTRAYLERLQNVHPIFRRLSVLVGSEYKIVRADLAGLENTIAEVCRDPEHWQDVINEDRTKELRSTSLNRIGFSVSYFSHAGDISLSHLPIERGGIEIALQGHSAGAEHIGGITVTWSSRHCQDFVSRTVLRRLFEETIRNWQLSVASTRSISFERAVKQDGDVYSGQWLLYLPFPYLGECLPPDIRWEPFHDGILIETTPHPPNVNDPADVAAGKRVREVLDQFGFAWQSTYAIHGWPPDEEEWRYEEFITGAPSGRKYRVRCIDFDGYDARRKVLLYAKLFRRLRRQPKQWGLRGWDGPVVNEARRQVRAAQGEPIEWHIGLEEPADRVRTLLADYTDITENQLKVIYTPLDLALRTGVPPKEFPT
jgi:pimeloyl-ACP methyl ester carboxylesterase